MARMPLSKAVPQANRPAALVNMDTLWHAGAQNGRFSQSVSTLSYPEHLLCLPGWRRRIGHGPSCREAHPAPHMTMPWEMRGAMPASRIWAGSPVEWRREGGHSSVYSRSVHRSQPMMRCFLGMLQHKLNLRRSQVTVA